MSLKEYHLFLLPTVLVSHDDEYVMDTALLRLNNLPNVAVIILEHTPPLTKVDILPLMNEGHFH